MNSPLRPVAGNDPVNKNITIFLLACGVLSSLYYVFLNIWIPTLYDGYSHVTYTISELSAIDAPTRALWTRWVVGYTLLFAVFGWGVIRSARNNHALRVMGVLVIAYCIFNTWWPPMHMRGNTPTLTDTMHIVWTIGTVLLMMLLMGFGAVASGRSFRIFTLVSAVLLILFGALTGKEAPNIPTNLPTPMIGIYERINIGLFMLWVGVMAIVLMRRERKIS